MVKNLIGYPLFLIITLYVGMLFQMQWVLVLFFAELCFFAFQIAMVCYQKKGLSVKVELLKTVLTEEEVLKVRILFKNTGKLPVQRAEAMVRYEWMSGQGKDVLVHGSVDRQDIQSYELLAGEFCGGQLKLLVPYVRIYDYFGIFSVKQYLHYEKQVLILPKLVSIPIFLSGKKVKTQEETSSNSYEQDFSELSNLREYQAGDPVKHIYWKKSMTGDDIFLRSGQAMEGSSVVFFLKLPKKEDALLFHYFLKAAGSVMGSLLEQGCEHFVVWQLGEYLERRTIRGWEGIYEVLIELLEQSERKEQKNHESNKERGKKQEKKAEASYQELCHKETFREVLWRQQIEELYQMQFAGEEMPEAVFLFGENRKNRSENRFQLLPFRKMAEERKKKEKPASLVLIQENGERRELLIKSELIGDRQEMEKLLEEMGSNETDTKRT